MTAKRIYLDHAGATPMDERVILAMQPYFAKEFGNPSALYAEGVKASVAVREARETVAKYLHAKSREIVFTSGGTESDNLALQGVVRAFRKENPDVVPHVVLSSIEHPALFTLARELEADGVITVSLLPVNEDGKVRVHELRELLRPETAFVSVMYANNEIGVVQPIKEISRVVKHHKKKVGKADFPYVHTDACQAVNYLDMHVDRLGVDLVSASGSKIYGPKGTGILYVREGTKIAPVTIGGGQEHMLRAGTENVSGVVGFASAFEITEEMKEKEAKRLLKLQTYFFDALNAQIPSVEINGSLHDRLPNNVHVSLPEIEQDVVVIEMDARGIACSAQSACKAGSGASSHVILALGQSDLATHVRFTMGRGTTQKHIDRAIEALVDIITKYKKG